MADPATITTTPAAPLLPAPPRTTGNPQSDLPLIVDWMYKLYQVIIVNGFYVSQNSQTQSNLNPNDLPDPATSNIATAQDTANKAFVLADEAFVLAEEAEATATGALTTAQTADARTNTWIHDALPIITGAATSASYTFGTPQPDTNYDVIPFVVGVTGVPTQGALTPKSISKGTGSFTVTLNTAPGGITTVSYKFLLVRF